MQGHLQVAASVLALGEEVEGMQMRTSWVDMDHRRAAMLVANGRLGGERRTIGAAHGEAGPAAHHPLARRSTMGWNSEPRCRSPCQASTRSPATYSVLSPAASAALK